MLVPVTFSKTAATTWNHLLNQPRLRRQTLHDVCARVQLTMSPGEL